MKYPFLLILFGLAILTGCEKEDDTTQPNTNDNYEVGFTYSYFNSADGAGPSSIPYNGRSDIIDFYDMDMLCKWQLAFDAILAEVLEAPKEDLNP